MTSVSLQALKPLHESSEEGGPQAHHHRSPGVSQVQLGVWGLGRSPYPRTVRRPVFAPTLHGSLSDSEWHQGGHSTPGKGAEMGERDWESGYLVSDPGSAVNSAVTRYVN